MMEETESASPIHDGSDHTTPADKHIGSSPPPAVPAVGVSPQTTVTSASSQPPPPSVSPHSVGASAVPVIPPGATGDDDDDGHDDHAIVRTISVAGGAQHAVPGADSPSPSGYPTKATAGDHKPAAAASAAAASKPAAPRTAADALAPATVGGSGLLKTLDSFASWGFGAVSRSLEVNFEIAIFFAHEFKIPFGCVAMRENA